MEVHSGWKLWVKSILGKALKNNKRVIWSEPERREWIGTCQLDAPSGISQGEVKHPDRSFLVGDKGSVEPTELKCLGGDAAKINS